MASAEGIREAEGAETGGAPNGAEGVAEHAVGAKQDRRARRRASLPAPAGTDPAPHDPPVEPRAERENDSRLQADKPPHWG